jgi:hypothetical protein
MKELSVRATTDAGLDQEAQSAGPEAKTYSVEFVRSGRTFTCAEDENVLDAAYAAGLSPISFVVRECVAPARRRRSSAPWTCSTTAAFGHVRSLRTRSSSAARSRAAVMVADV